MTRSRRVPATAMSLALLLGPVVATAADDAGDSWYLGGAALFGNLQLDSAAIDDDAVGGKVIVGYRANRWFGLEGSFLRTGEFEDDQTPGEPGGEASIDVDGFALNALLYAPLRSEDIGVYAKAGIYDFDQQLEVKAEDGSLATSTSRGINGITAGLGVQVRIAARVDIRAEGEWYDLDGADLWTLSLGAYYHFGGSR